MAWTQEDSWKPVTGSVECSVWVDDWHHLHKLHLAAVKLKDLATEYMGIRRTASIKYEAQLSICKGISSFFVVDNHFKNWEKAIVRQGQGHAKEGSAYLQYHVLGIEVVEGRALGTCNTMQNSRKAQRKKSIGI